MVAFMTMLQSCFIGSALSVLGSALLDLSGSGYCHVIGLTSSRLQSPLLIVDVSLGTFFCEEPLSLFQGTYDPSFSLALQCKDNRLGYQIATKHKVGEKNFILSVLKRFPCKSSAMR